MNDSRQIQKVGTQLRPTVNYLIRECKLLGLQSYTQWNLITKLANKMMGDANLTGWLGYWARVCCPSITCAWSCRFSTCRGSFRPRVSASDTPYTQTLFRAVLYTGIRNKVPTNPCNISWHSWGTLPHFREFKCSICRRFRQWRH